MKKYFIVILIVLSFLTFLAQNPVGFDAMCNGYIEGTVPLATPKQVNRLKSVSEIILLDAREIKEYNISHIDGALNVGYDNFSISSVKSLNKDKPVYVYCSIGYRSEKIGEQLQKAGFKKVYNVYGGIFNWINTGYELVDKSGNKTTKVHGYNSSWSKWLNVDKCTKVVD